MKLPIRSILKEGMEIEYSLYLHIFCIRFLSSYLELFDIFEGATDDLEIKSFALRGSELGESGDDFFVLGDIFLAYVFAVAANGIL